MCVHRLCLQGIEEVVVGSTVTDGSDGLMLAASSLLCVTLYIFNSVINITSFTIMTNNWKFSTLQQLKHTPLA